MIKVKNKNSVPVHPTLPYMCGVHFVIWTTSVLCVRVCRKWLWIGKVFKGHLCYCTHMFCPIFKILLQTLTNVAPSFASGVKWWQQRKKVRSIHDVWFHYSHTSTHSLMHGHGTLLHNNTGLLSFVILCANYLHKRRN